MSRAIPIALLLAAALTACGDGDGRRTLDTAPIERGIARGIERDRPGTKVVEVTCPDDVELERGGEFTCRVRGSRRGQSAVATVTQVDDKGRVRYRVP